MRIETETAIRAVVKALQIIDSRDGADDITSKGGIDLVTAADVSSEDAIRTELGQTFPEHVIVGEERGGTPVAGQPYWLVDPICGTRPYASNVPLYCTNIALVENGEVTAAAIGIGSSDEILYAEKGNGAFMRSDGGDKPIHASDKSNTLWIGTMTEQGADVVRNVLLKRRWYVWQFSSSVGYAYLAAGRISGIIHFAPPLSPVHTAAGCFIAQEAGAIVTDPFDGSPWQLGMHSFLLASTPALHQELFELIKQSY